VVADDGQASETVFRLIGRTDDYSLLEAELLTGRTHQIRVHAASMKHPILGDDRYGNFELNKSLRKNGLKRMFLHAARLSFTHPLTGEALTIEAPLPRELDAFWKKCTS
jgi:23S rRNA pseudouridine955/2504/2580 synthase